MQPIRNNAGINEQPEMTSYPVGKGHALDGQSHAAALTARLAGVLAEARLGQLMAGLAGRERVDLSENMRPSDVFPLGSLELWKIAGGDAGRRIGLGSCLVLRKSPRGAPAAVA